MLFICNLARGAVVLLLYKETHANLCVKLRASRRMDTGETGLPLGVACPWRRLRSDDGRRELPRRVDSGRPPVDLTDAESQIPDRSARPDDALALLQLSGAGPRRPLTRIVGRGPEGRGMTAGTAAASSIAFIGFGEAAQAFLAGWRTVPDFSARVATYDIKTDSPNPA